MMSPLSSRTAHCSWEQTIFEALW